MVSPESMQDGEADGVKDWVRSVEVVDEHDEETVVGQLVEVCCPRLLVLEEHMCHCHQHLVCVCVCVCVCVESGCGHTAPLYIVALLLSPVCKMASAVVRLCQSLNHGLVRMTASHVYPPAIQWTTLVSGWSSNLLCLYFIGNVIQLLFLNGTRVSF